MSALPDLVDEIGKSLGQSSQAVRTRALARFADLLLHYDDRLPPEGVEMFDRLMVRSAPLADVEGRAAAAERLGGAARAPGGILRLLALDDAIVVARPVLSRSGRLDDQLLMQAAAEKGTAHRLAICARPSLSEMVTDVLVASPDREVGLALAGHAGARLSQLGAATLIHRSRDDDALQDLMGTRTDLAPHLSATLLRVVREGVRDRLLARLPAEGGRPDAPAPPRSAPGPGEAELRALAQARSGEVERVFAQLTGLSRALANRLLTEPGNDLLLVTGRARGWSWPTMRALLCLRDPGLTERHQFRRAEETFDAVTAATAERALRFLAGAGAPRQVRLKVR